MRRTSIEAYRIIRDSGLLSAARWKVYDFLYCKGPITRNELDYHLAEGRPNPAYSRRLAEMERAGVLARVGERPCTITGFTAELWDVTDQLPRKVERQTTNAQKLRQIAMLVTGQTAQDAPFATIEAIRELVAA